LEPQFHHSVFVVYPNDVSSYPNQYVGETVKNIVTICYYSLGVHHDFTPQFTQRTTAQHSNPPSVHARQ
jgi:hypothetical protein